MENLALYQLKIVHWWHIFLAKSVLPLELAEDEEMIVTS